MTRHISAGEEDGRLLFLFTRLFWDAHGGENGTASARALAVTDALLKDEASARALYACAPRARSMGAFDRYCGPLLLKEEAPGRALYASTFTPTRPRYARVHGSEVSRQVLQVRRACACACATTHTFGGLHVMAASGVTQTLCFVSTTSPLFVMSSRSRR